MKISERKDSPTKHCHLPSFIIKSIKLATGHPKLSVLSDTRCYQYVFINHIVHYYLRHLTPTIEFMNGI